MISNRIKFRGGLPFIPHVPGTAWTGTPTALTVTTKDLWVTASQGVNAYNHHPMAFQHPSGRVWVFHSTNARHEDTRGFFTRAWYSDDLNTWTGCTPLTAWDSTEETAATVSDHTAVTPFPCKMVRVGSRYFLIYDVHVCVWSGGNLTSRTGLCMLAQEFDNTTTFGTPGVISGTDTRFSTHPLKEQILNEIYKRGATTGWNLGMLGTMPVSTSDANLTEDIIYQSGNGFLRFSRAYNTLSPTDKIWIQTSRNGINFGTDSVSVIPNAPSRIAYLKHSSGKHLLAWNQASSRDPLNLSISTDGLDFTANQYTIRSGTKTTATFSGMYKGGGASYVHLLELSDGRVLASYSIAKEDISISIFTLP